MAEKYSAEDNARRIERRAKKNDLADVYNEALKKVDVARVERCRVDFWAFIHEYLVGDSGVFSYAPYAESKQIVDNMVAAFTSGMPYHIRMSRGGGKTSFFLALCLWAMLYGYADFVVSASSVTAQAKALLDDIVIQMTDNAKLVQDFPAVSVPIRAAEGAPMRNGILRIGEQLTRYKKCVDMVVFPTVKGALSSGAVIKAVGFDSSVRGLRVGSKRPKLVLLDDLQTDDMARNPMRIEEGVQKINQSYLGLGAANSQVAVIMASTPIRAYDLSERFANDREWRTFTYPMLLSMPSNMELWEEWAEIRSGERLTGAYDAPQAAAFYASHRAEMDAGAVPFWHECFDRKAGEVSAIEHAMRKRFGTAGKLAFESEYMMKPPVVGNLYEIDATAVVSCSNGRAFGDWDKAQYPRLIGTVDVMNTAGLRWQLVAFNERGGAQIVIYGKYPASGAALWDRSATQREQANALLRGLAAVCTAMIKSSTPPTYIAIDSGFMTKQIMQFCAGDTRLLPLKGANFKQFKPRISSGALRSNVIDATEYFYSGRGQYGIFNVFHADFFKEFAQRAFIAAKDSDFRACLNGNPVENANYAAEICGEKLIDKRDNGTETEYTWRLLGANHFLDGLAMAYAAAHWKRVYSLDGERKKQRKTRKQSMIELLGYI